MRRKYLKRVALCAACLVTYGAGVCTGHFRMKSRYDEVSRSLEKSVDEQEKLALKLEEMEALEEESFISYPLNDLIVADVDIAGEKETYILESFGIYYREVHGYFNAYFLQDAERLNYPEEYYSFSNATSLFPYLTEDELDTCARNHGEITLKAIDEIFDRIQNENDFTNVSYRYVRRNK